MQENLKAKYGLTDKELKRATDQIPFGKIACDGVTIIALVDLVANGDISGNAKPDVLFKSSEHEQFYNQMLSKCTEQDSYHRALFYALGINEDTRRHVNEIYDFDTRCIKLRALKAGWVTSGSLAVMRLAFNLFTDHIPEDRGKDNYAPTELFSHGDVEWLCRAIAVRYC